MIVSRSFSEGVGGILVLAVATWWVVSPRSYVACIRKVPWLWISTYPMNSKTWFPKYLRAMGIAFWVVGLLAALYCYRSLVH
jgi:hypothetical protein